MPARYIGAPRSIPRATDDVENTAAKSSRSISSLYATRSNSEPRFLTTVLR